MSFVRGVATALAVSLLAWSATLPSSAQDAATFLTTCEKGKSDDAKPKCKCVAEGIEKAFKDKERAFAFQSMTMTAGDLANAPPSGLDETAENAVTDKTYEQMQGCGLLK